MLWGYYSYTGADNLRADGKMHGSKGGSSSSNAATLNPQSETTENANLRSDRRQRHHLSSPRVHEHAPLNETCELSTSSKSSAPIRLLTFSSVKAPLSSEQTFRFLSSLETGMDAKRVVTVSARVDAAVSSTVSRWEMVRRKRFTGRDLILQQPASRTKASMHSSDT
ncbi:hypothetical protein ATANTOWER_000988 [Ataeniobius toweri]|uniref:Uncharacterized protein n=1 Tax=Ataeniobius toweri TaxID=208326 RepID=A0ABU7BG63_9TELE|nr:hypothetical protein [Ataeniobius toweri]